ncbi:MAG: Crp/Fnr family transcriptional regulator [Erythrobacter sp.]
MDDHQALIARLEPDTLLRALSPDQLDSLLRSSTRRELKRGEVILQQGDEPGDFAVFILSGSVKVSMVSATGREIILNYSSAGDVVGEIAMLDQQPRTATVSATEPSSVLVIPAHAFQAAALANPASMAGVMRALASRLRQSNLVVESDRTFSMAPRLARALVRLLDPADPEGRRLRFNPSQSDLGAFAGIARENVSRLMSDWEERGVLKRSDRLLEIIDREYLDLLAEFGEE